MANRMEENVAKEGKTASSGLTGVFKTLAKQHSEAGSLLKKAEGISEPSKRADEWKKIRVELLSHEKAEMREIYPVLRQHAETKALAEQHDSEAKDLESMILKLDGTDTSSTGWLDLLKKITDGVVRHAKEEENEIFPKAQQTLGKPEAERLDARFLQTQKEIKNQL